MKMNYFQLAIEVEKLYAKQVDESDVNEHIEFISEFIKSCGWTEEEYMECWLKYNCI